ncbi:MAG: ABC transporter permease, partial [Candidatus Hydrogenedentes bacterium]|nr:ABC transporter permease [Candidatus Hydrogenedentota bacterium]
MSARRLAPPAPAVPARPQVTSSTSPHEPAAAVPQGALARRDEGRLRIASLVVFVLRWQLGASLADSRTLPDPLAVLARIGAETASLA